MNPKLRLANFLLFIKRLCETYLTFSKSKDHSTPLMKSCNMLNLFDIHKFMVSTFVYKCVKRRISVCENWYRLYRNIYNTHSNICHEYIIEKTFWQRAWGLVPASPVSVVNRDAISPRPSYILKKGCIKSGVKQHCLFSFVLVNSHIITERYFLLCN